MKRNLIVILLSFSAMLCTLPASAQLKGFSIGPYVEAVWPQGKMAQESGKGIGVGVAGNIKLSSRLTAIGSYGYLHFSKESEGTAVNATPLRLGLKYKLPILYFKLESGSAKLNRDRGSALILSPGVGIRILGLDVQGSYETWFREGGQSFASLRVAYHF